MGRICAVRNCGKIPYNRCCHRLPFHSPERLQLWLLFLGFDTNTPVDVLREADHRVCALHFRREDYVQSTGLRKKSPKKLYLQRAAVPTLLGPTVDEEDLGLHITIQRGTAFPLMEKCMTCCPPGTYHCPFCSPAFFKPAKRSKVMVHLEFHLKKACQLGGYTIHRCGLDCAKRPHYHCLYCIAMLGGKLDFYRHVEFCKKMQKRTDNPQDETLLTNRARADPEKDMSSYFMGPNESESEDVPMDAQSKTEGEGSSSSKSDILLVCRPSDGNAAVKEVPLVTKQHKMLQVNLDKPQDCDEFYFMNLAKMFKKLAPSKKTDVRMKIERVLFEAEFM